VRPTSYIIDIAIIASLAANLFASVAIITAKTLSKTDDTMTMMLYSGMGIVILSGIFTHDYTAWHMLTFYNFLALFGTGVLGVTAQYCLITALKISQPSFLAPFEYTRLIFGSLIGFFIFYEIPDLYVIVGSLIIIFSTYLITIMETHRTKNN
jgi:drug/metabolite transporter (DMT)-like permease